MATVTRWRHRVNLGRTEGKLEVLLKRFRFQSVREHLAEHQHTDEAYTYGIA